MEGSGVPVFLPPGYGENALFLMVQSPRVIYAYWELSPGLKDALAIRDKMQIRLNVLGREPYTTRDLDQSVRSYYFSDVEPGTTYNCEIGIYNSGKQFLPFLRSNLVTTPNESPPEGVEPGEKSTYYSIDNISSWSQYRKS